MFLAKNKWEGHHFDPSVSPSWIQGDYPQALCPTSVLHQYVDAMEWAPLAHLVMWPTPLATKQHTAQLVCQVIDSQTWRRVLLVRMFSG